ncbi:MAG: PAS domain S-box protein, partial [Bacteroidales bacterium]|nr:PAS domain S-box protein [Bacteroidales bacterium]
MNKEIKQLKQFFAFLISGLTLLFVVSLYWNIRNEYKNNNEYAIIEASASYNKDLLFRRWASMHGGVYVPVTDSTLPNPYLEFIPDRDISTVSGKNLTLMNPAYMTRQIFEIAENQYGVKGHITSLNPIRPENKADEWETKALKKFQEGLAEYSSLEEIDGIMHMRFMHAMKVEESCIKCHAEQGYKVGDIRGGISVSVPMDKYDQIAKTQTKILSLTHLTVYTLVLLLSILGYYVFLKELKKRDAVRQELFESEKKFKILYNNSPDMFISVSPKNANILMCNNTLLKKTGYTSEELIGSKIFKMYDECCMDEVKTNFEQFKNTGVVHNKELVVKRKNGSRILVNLNVTSVRNEKNEILYSISSWRDITEQKTAEANLRTTKRKAEEIQHKFLSLFQQAAAGVAIINSQTGEFLDINQKYCNICGYTKPEMLRSDFMKLTHPDDLNLDLLNMQKLKNKEISEFSMDKRYIRKDKSIIWVRLNVSPLRFNGSQLLTHIAIVEDITERKNMEIELLMAKERAEESNKLKTEFINNMSHEIRTPMNGIIGFSEFLENPEVTQEKREYYARIVQNSSRQLLHIIDDILEISTLGTKQVKVDTQEFFLNDLLMELFSIHNLKAQESNIHLYINKALENSASLINTDKFKLSKILNNLIENAIKYTISGYIEVGYLLSNESYQIYVKDTGIGIDPKNHQTIFERFSQEEKEISRKPGGIGLGLSIAKENAELLGGNISLESEKGKGSTFYVTIPFK